MNPKKFPGSYSKDIFPWVELHLVPSLSAGGFRQVINVFAVSLAFDDRIFYIHFNVSPLLVCEYFVDQLLISGYRISQAKRYCFVIINSVVRDEYNFLFSASKRLIW